MENGDRLLASIVLAGAIGCTPPAVAAAEPGGIGDPLRAVLEQSKANNRGLTFYVNGQAIPGVVVGVGEKYLLASSRERGTVVILLERIDAVAGFVDAPAQPQ